MLDCVSLIWVGANQNLPLSMTIDTSESTGGGPEECAAELCVYMGASGRGYSFGEGGNGGSSGVVAAIAAISWREA